MIDLLYRSPLFNILILETWSYVALGLRLSLSNFSALTAVLVVLIYPSLKNLLVEILLALICPVVFYLNAGHGWLQAVPVIYFMLLFAILKFSLAKETEDIDILELMDTPSPFSAGPAYANQTLTLNQRPHAAPGPQILSFGPHPGQDYTASSSSALPAAEPPAPSRRNNLQWTVQPLLIIGIGFVLGWLWNPAPRTSLSLEPDAEKPYFSYIQPSRVFLENKSALLKERELNSYLDTDNTAPSPYFRLLTFSDTAITHLRLPDLSAPPKLTSMYRQITSLLRPPI
ncbi:hypothetical protein AUK40_06230 [Candidatus Wirthbacteria bacterium CG2_30_54_11]|uniref:Uncharacterized protein n=1 Tax=Candidatus Wirthbacteria bacterium CG2_30_54_11 TaxID=1817892 RepID=A0A1J5IVD2_9BACT|nr:MAG: hypothetical protein AUK40_06230 [Candidatus Wirthbacteria bacterium CG2_30_54_11]